MNVSSFLHFSVESSLRDKYHKCFSCDLTKIENKISKLRVKFTVKVFDSWAIVTGLEQSQKSRYGVWGVYHNGVEVFNPSTKRVCKMASMPTDRRSMASSSMCGDLLCPYTTLRNCARWVGGSFVAAAVTLVNMRERHLCWARPNGVLLLGGLNSPKGRFFRSSKLNSFLWWKSLKSLSFNHTNLMNENHPSDNRISEPRRFSLCSCFQPDVAGRVDNNTFLISRKINMLGFTPRSNDTIYMIYHLVYLWLTNTRHWPKYMAPNKDTFLNKFYPIIAL